MKPRKQRKWESGQTLVEFALVLPLLLILIFGAIEFGRIFHATHVITSAAREGARTAAVHEENSPYSYVSSKISGSVESFANTVTFEETDSDYNREPDEGEVVFTITKEEDINNLLEQKPWTVTVKVKGKVPIIVPLIGRLLANDGYKIIENQAKMRIEYSITT